MRLSLFSLAATAAAVKVTPVEKVINLLEDLLAQTKSEGEEEKRVYDKYSCFCRDKSKNKSDEILREQTEIDGAAAKLEEQVGIRDQRIAEIAELNAEIDTLIKEMEEETTRWLADKTHRELVIADLEKANKGLDGAIQAVKDSNPDLASLVAVKQTIQKHLLIAEALGMTTAKKVQSFMQKDDGDRYDSQSGGILQTLKDLEEEFQAKLDEANSEFTKAKNAHDELMTAKNDAKTSATNTRDTKITEKDEAIKQIGEAEKVLNDSGIELTNAQAYLKDLTEQCELKAREWDQRSGLRAGEVNALEQALDIMNNKVKGKDEAANKRALLNQQKAVVKRADEDIDDMDVGDLSFVQTTSSKRVVSLLKTAQTNRRVRAVANLQSKAKKLQNRALFDFAARLGEGPFDKVKKLIAQLIERLLTEAANEATQKGWCDTELAKATKERDYRKSDIEDLNTSLEDWEARRDQSKANMDRLEDELQELNDAMTEATQNRDDENAVNVQTIKDGREGRDAVAEALKILKDFYKGEHGVGGANSASVSLIQASPVADDAPEVHSGAYQGNQAQSGGILGLLEVIHSDFERTISTTQADEKESYKAYRKFARATKTSISAAETDLKNQTATNKSMKNKIETGMSDLKKQQKLQDSAVKTLEELKPACIDTGMSFEDRKAKREEEIAALETALCQLDPEKVEAECQ